MKRSHFVLNVLPLVLLIPAACQDATGPKATPIADAGVDQAALTGEVVPLDGSGSFVPDGGHPAYLWSFQAKPDGSRAVISDSATLSASFTPDLVGTYVVNLTVTIGTLRASDESEIIVAAGTVPALLVPGEDEVLDNGCYPQSDWIEWAFEWSEVPGASLYHLYVTGPSATFPVVNDPVIRTEFEYRTIGYVASHNLFGWTWKVRAMVDEVWQAWTPPRVFDVEPRNTDCVASPEDPPSG